MVKKTINKLLGCSALCLLPFFNAGAAEIATNTAQMQAMDKITGKVSLIEVPVNGAVKFGSFSILVRSCKTRSPEETPENFAFVDVVDDYDDKPVNIFRGWMVSSSPALNAVEHPIYDVWLLKCIDAKVDLSKLLSPEQLKERDALETVSASERVVEINPNVAAETADMAAEAKTDAVTDFVSEELPTDKAEKAEPAAVEAEKIVLSPEESIQEDGAPKSLLDFNAPSKDAVLSENEVPDENNVNELKNESAIPGDVSGNAENVEVVTEKIVIDSSSSEASVSSEQGENKKEQLIEFEEEVEEPLDFEAEALKKE